MATNEAILIIDDEPKLSHSLELILQRAGYAVSSAKSAQEAIQLLEVVRFSLVFLDIKLPDQSGIKLLPKIRSIYPDMPVLILTAFASLETAIEAVRAGERDYLLKPIEPEAILERVKKILENQRKPLRRAEITKQIQVLLNEMQSEYVSEVSPYELHPIPTTDDSTRYLKRGGLVLDLLARVVLFNERSLILAPSTFDYLVTLARHLPKIVAYDILVKESQGYQVLSRQEAKGIARWQIHELHKALKKDLDYPNIIITIRNVGYRLII